MTQEEPAFQILLDYTEELYTSLLRGEATLADATYCPLFNRFLGVSQYGDIALFEANNILLKAGRPQIIQHAYRASLNPDAGYQQPVSYRYIATETLLSTSLIANTELNNIGHNLTYKRSAEQKEAMLMPWPFSSITNQSLHLHI
ncbi:hypothetical protein DPMN_036724 [Dreissena polymorpha]|uniref:Uncharacterized protein n=1 Tax=Dreissena polymorpha TaxID=45954 RepID=A0A9D4MD22_DREPO|nr:hypothetical protein DPMN_036724 [Dreissena polymorpha]